MLNYKDIKELTHSKVIAKTDLEFYFCCQDIREKRDNLGNTLSRVENLKEDNLTPKLGH